MFDIGVLEFLVLAIVALFVFGPERLPQAAAKAARGVRQLRQMANNARRDLSDELGPEFENFDFDDLRNPRGAIKKYVLDGIDEDDVRIDKDLDLREDMRNLDDDDGHGTRRRSARSSRLNGNGGSLDGDGADGSSTMTRSRGTERPDFPPFDSDAT